MASWDDVSSPVATSASDWDAVSAPVNQPAPDQAPTPSPTPMQNAALSSVYSPDNSGARARVTAYGANYISQIPGLKELGSAEAAALGAGQGDTFAQRYGNLEDAQAAMRDAGAQSNPDMTNVADASGMIEGMGLGGKLVSAIAPEAAAARVASYAKTNPYMANAAVAIPSSAIYGFANGDSAQDRLSQAGQGALVGGVLSGPLYMAVHKGIEPAAKLASPYTSAILGKFYDNPVGSAISDAASNVGSKIDSLFGNDAAQVPITSTRGTALTTGTPSNIPSFDTTPTAQQMRSAASGLYQDAADKGGVLTPQFTNDFISKVTDMQPQTSAGKIINGDNALSQLTDRLQQLKNQPLTLQAAQEVDEGLGNLVDQNSDPMTGKLTKDGKQIYDVQTTFRNMINNADQNQVVGNGAGFQALSDARGAWTTARKLADIERIQNRAAGMDQPATGIKTGLNTLINNQSRFASFNPQEQAAIRQAQKTGGMTNLLRFFGSKLIPMGSGMAGEAVGGHVGAAVAGGVGYGASSAARNAASAIQMNKVDALKRVIAAPYINAPPQTMPALTGGIASVPASQLTYQSMLSGFYGNQ